MRKKQVIVLVSIIVLVCAFYLIRPSITSFVVTKLTVVHKEVANCSFYLHSGWNLIGLSCNLKDNSPESLFYIENHSVRNNLISIHSYDPSKKDSWKIYNPDLPSYVVQDLKVLTRADGYWINCKNETLLTINGTLVSPTYIELLPSWNLIGYPQLNPLRINDTFIGLDIENVYYYNSSGWFIYQNGTPWEDQGLKFIKAHYGLWINANKRGVWHVS